jgi:hypothetical protein
MGGKLEGTGEIMNATIVGQIYVLPRNLKWILAK